MFPNTNATIHTLSNGLKVILAPDTTAPVISTQLWVETGSIHEGDKMGAGLSHLLEHMVFKGTASFSGEELSQTVLAAGGQWNAYTSFDRTVYYIDGSAESADTFLKVLLEMVFRPTFPEDDFEKEKGVIRREIDMGLDDPDGRSSRLLFSTALDQDGRSQPVIGHLELFNLVSYQDMLDYHRSRYTTDNAFLCIAGEFDANALLSKLEALCADIPRSFTRGAEVKKQPAQLGTRIQREPFAVPVSKLNLAWQTPGLEHPDACALDLLATILGGGRSSRLYLQLREERNLCQHIGAWSWNSAGMPGLFAISAEVETDKRDALQQEILTLLSALPDSFQPDELAKAKRMSLVSQFKTLTTASGRASDLASNWHETRNLNFTKNYLEMLDAVTLDDLRRVCRTYLSGTRTLTVTSIDPVETTADTEPSTSTAFAKEIQSHTLSNGLQLHLCRNPRLPMVSIRGIASGGLAGEQPERAGISTLLSTLLSKGSTRRSASTIATTLESLGATLNFSSGYNSSATAASCLSSDLGTVLEIIGEVLTQPAFPEDSIRFERENQLTAVQEADEDPLSLAFRHMRWQLFAGKGYGLNQLGNEASLASIDKAALTAHHAATYCAANMSFAIFGDIDIPQTIALAEQHLCQLPTGERQAQPEQAVAEASTHAFHLDKQQATLTLGFPGAGIHSPDTPALSLLKAWCSDMAGPLFSRIREDLGLAYYCGAMQLQGPHTGLFAFYLGTSPDQLDLAKNELIATIQNIAENGMDAATLDSVKNSWLSKYALANQSNGSLANICATDTLFGFSTNHHVEAMENIKSVSPEDIQNAAFTYFAKRTPTIVTVSPAAVTSESL